ncbi:phosphoribosylglycinamide formyltransferase, partial [Rothia kristinae]
IETFVLAPRDFPDRPAWNRALEEKLASYAPDLLLFAGFMRIVDAQLVARFERRIVNTHPALLPSFPGAHGVRDALAHGVKITGVTVHLVDSGVDTGPILAQAAVPVLEGDTEQSLHERIKEQERPLLVRTLRELAARA